MNEPELLCCGCRKSYPIRDGVLDMVGDGSGEVITPFQRLMQSRPVVSIYEGFWRRAGYFIASSRTFEKEIRTVMQLASRADSTRVLDLACGPGIFTRPLAKQASGFVVGLDLSWPMLREARQRATAEGLANICLVRGTVFRLPFISGAFPLVNCCGALHLFDDPDRALDEIRRVSGPQGHVCIQTTIRPQVSGGAAYMLERFIRFGFFDEAELRERIRRRGLALLETERHRISFTLLARHIS
jgi:SAM-dependent methyltransferase